MYNLIESTRTFRFCDDLYKRRKSVFDVTVETKLFKIFLKRLAFTKIRYNQYSFNGVKIYPLFNRRIPP